MLNIFNKILEKLVFTRVISFLNKNNTLFTIINPDSDRTTLHVKHWVYASLDKEVMANGAYLFSLTNHFIV